MEFFDELFEDETFSENLLDYIKSPEQYTPIMQNPQLPDTVKDDDNVGLLYDPVADEVNPNQETLDLYQMQQEEQQNYQEQVDNYSLEIPLPINILDIPNEQFYQEPIDSTMVEIPQQFQEINNGFTNPTMIELSNLFPDPQLLLPLREEDQSNIFGNNATRVINNFQFQQNQPNLLQASTFSIREPMFTNQYQNLYNGNQNMVATSIPYWQRNLSSNQQFSFASSSNQQFPFASSSKPYGQQWHPSFRYPTFNTQTQISPYTNSFTSFQGIQENINNQSLIHPLVADRTINNNNRFVLGHQQQNQFNQGELSLGQRMIAQRNVYPIADNTPTIRMVNKVYDPRYESVGLYIDPHFRKFAEINKSPRSYLMKPY